jgi:hypothetical protein
MSGRRKWALTAAIATAALATACIEPTSTAPDAAGPETPTAASTSAATLISCPTDQPTVTEATIGLLGGLLQLGTTTISIPLGAVLVPTTFRIEVPASNYMEISVTGGDAEHFLFERPVSITIDYSRCDRAVTDAAPLSVWYIDEDTKALLEDMGGVDDKVARKITFRTGHLSGYAIAN